MRFYILYFFRTRIACNYLHIIQVKRETRTDEIINNVVGSCRTRRIGRIILYTHSSDVPRGKAAYLIYLHSYTTSCCSSYYNIRVRENALFCESLKVVAANDNATSVIILFEFLGTKIDEKTEVT